MILKQLSRTYLGSFKDITENFESFKSSYNLIQENTEIDSLSDLEILILLFENSLPEDYFYNKSHLLNFCNALPSITLERIKAKLNLQSIDSIIWDLETSNFFIKNLGLPEKFKFEDDSVKSEVTGITSFACKEKQFKKLKDYQSTIYFDCFNYLNVTPNSRCIIQMPTGSGKTRTAMEIVCEIINTHKKSVIWLANTEELCDQAYESFNEVWEILGNHQLESINHSRLKGKCKSKVDELRFHVTTLQSINSDSKFNKIADWGIDSTNLALLVIDEAHIAIANTYKVVISKFLALNSKLLGLSATPGRSMDNDEENQNLSDFFFNKIFKVGNIEMSDIEYLRSKRILSNAYFHTIEGATLNNICSEKELKDILLTNSFPAKIEKFLSDDAGRNASIIHCLSNLLNNKKKIIFFATSVSHSKLISTLLNSQGFKASHIDGKSGKYRRQIISNFKSGEIEILCNYGVLSTGFDDPKVDVVFIARKTNSIILYSQIIGRGLRGPEIGGTQVCDIYTVIDNLSDLPSNDEISSYFDEYFINKI
jgi:superfamily II DNA or RNA helicase